MFQKFVGFWESVGWLANAIQIGAVVFVVLNLWGQAVAYRRRRKIQELAPRDGAVAVAIGVGRPIEATVLQFLKKRYPGNTGESVIPLVGRHYTEGFLAMSDFLAVLQKIRRDVFDELRTRGDIGEVHLFYGGPYAIAAGIGAIVDNWVPVHLYMYNINKGDYEFAFTLHGETVKGV